jgi:hypothetical protein
MATVRKSAGLIAALLLIAIGLVNLRGSGLPFGIVLTLAGVAGFVWQVKVLMASRQDRYDLKRLYDDPYPGEDQPEEFDWQHGANEFPICHRCGHAVAKEFARCPDCGSQVR